MLSDPHSAVVMSSQPRRQTQGLGIDSQKQPSIGHPPTTPPPAFGRPLRGIPDNVHKQLEDPFLNHHDKLDQHQRRGGTCHPLHFLFAPALRCFSPKAFVPVGLHRGVTLSSTSPTATTSTSSSRTMTTSTETSSTRTFLR